MGVLESPGKVLNFFVSERVGTLLFTTEADKVQKKNRKERQDRQTDRVMIQYKKNYTKLHN